MFKVIQDQEEAAGSQVRVDTLAGGVGGDVLEVEGLRDGGVDVGGVLERDQIDKPDPIGEGVLHAAGRGEREPGFADAARSHQGEETYGIAEEVVAQVLQFLIAADQGRGIREEGKGQGPWGPPWRLVKRSLRFSA